MSNKLTKGWASIHQPGHNEHIPGTTAYLRSRTFQSWFNMIVRCYYESSPSYENYGGRGISVTSKWLTDFQTFLSDMGHRPKGMTLDRINPNGDYHPSNCRWATPTEQRRNQRRVLNRKKAA